MREPAERDVNKNEVLQKCFNCLIENGLENASIKNFCEATGMTASSIYYWFTDKDEIVLNSIEYGMREIAGELFTYVSKHVTNMKEMCNGFPTIVEKNSVQLRVVLQVAASPRYGDKIKKIWDMLFCVYDDYAEKLSKQLNVPFEATRSAVDIVVSCVIDAVIWKGWDKLSKELNYVLNKLIS